MSTSVTDTMQLRAIAEHGAAELGPHASAAALLEWTDATFGRDYIVASNMQDAVLVQLAAAVRPGVDVLFLDTGYHFVETYGTRDAVAVAYDVNVINAEPETTVEQQDRVLGRNLFASDANECCRLRKVVPLQRALTGYRAWVTGLRRVEAPTRANAPLISFDEGFGLVKINPLAAWTDDDMAHYIETHGILVNPLVDEGYPSIGCAPCTRKPEPGSDPRSGRWAGLAKTECGLHPTAVGQA